MLNKVYDRLKIIIKNNYKFLIGLVIIAILFNYKLDYEIYTYGKPLNVGDRINIENSYKQEGEFYLTYVTSRPGLIPLILLSYIIPSWDLVDLNNSRIENESFNQIIERGKIELNTVNNMALKNALEEANIEYSESNSSLIVYYVFKDAQTDLKSGDIIEEVNGIKVSNYEDFINIINNKENSEIVFFKVISNGKIENKKGIVKEENDRKIIGLYLAENIDIISDVKVDFNYKDSESGSSGGVMSALYIYNALTKEDITKGKKIAGTGTISYDGTIGQIDGVKYKLLGAIKDKDDIFIVPSGDNYEEAKKLVKDNNYNITLIEAKNFKKLIEDLKNI